MAILHQHQGVMQPCSLQVFKWERRKGWDILLQAFLSEFTSKANVALYLKTSPFHSSNNFAEQMQQWVGEHIPGSTAGTDKLPAVYVIDEHMTQESLRSLYAAVDCFVLPSRCAAVSLLCWGK